MSMLTELKDLVRLHNFSWGDVMEMTPIEYQAVRLMITEDIKPKS